MANAMKIVTDEKDEFTGNRTVITSWEHMGKNQCIHVRFRQQNNATFLDFKLVYDGSIVISQGDKLMCKSTEGDIASLMSTKTAMGGRGDGAVGTAMSMMWGISTSYVGDVSWFGDNAIRLTRIYTTDGYIDREISENDGRKIRKLYMIFHEAVSGKPNASPVADYTIVYYEKASGAKDWNVVNEEYKKDLTKDEVQKIITDWKGKSDDKRVYDCKITKHK